MEMKWSVTADVQPGELYQTSVIAALLKGVYDGEVLYAHVMERGDFGLGTFNALDGEMVASGGEFYQLHADGSATLVRPEQKTPFAAVTRFSPQRSMRRREVMGKSGLLAAIKEVAEQNLFTAVRINGLFHEVHTRTVAKQSKPYPELIGATDSQQTNTSRMQRGILAGFLSPAYSQGLQVPGFHLHYLSEDKQTGGHMLDFTAEDIIVEIAPLSRISVELPNSSTFLGADLEDFHIAEELKQAEG